MLHTTVTISHWLINTYGSKHILRLCCWRGFGGSNENPSQMVFGALGMGVCVYDYDYM